MPTKKTANATPIYQLKLVLEQVTPLVWRRLLIPADTKCARTPSSRRQPGKVLEAKPDPAR
jgi:hypothetical protein